MLEDDYAPPPIEEWLDGRDLANEFVLSEISTEHKQLPGFFSFLVCAAVFGFLFWGAFQDFYATFALTLVPILLLSYDRDRRKADLNIRFLIERQNGMIRSLYRQSDRLNRDTLNYIDDALMAEPRRQAEKDRIDREFERVRQDLRRTKQ